jgi:hypothetical protein
MTDKQFVKNIYPDAKAHTDFGDNGYVDWAIYSHARIISKFVPEPTAKIAWKNAVARINEQMMEKLES